jgi:hypothetical protein
VKSVLILALSATTLAAAGSAFAGDQETAGYATASLNTSTIIEGERWGGGANMTAVDRNCECSVPTVNVPFYTVRPPAPPIRVRAPGLRVSSAPVFAPSPAIYIQGPPIYVDAPPVRSRPPRFTWKRPTSTSARRKCPSPRRKSTSRPLARIIRTSIAATSLRRRRLRTTCRRPRWVARSMAVPPPIRPRLRVVTLLRRAAMPLRPAATPLLPSAAARATRKSPASAAKTSTFGSGNELGRSVERRAALFVCSAPKGGGGGAAE